MTGQLSKFKDRVIFGMGVVSVLEKGVEENKKQIALCRAKEGQLRKVNQIIQAAAILTQEELDKRLSELVRASLKVIFGEEYDFHVIFEESYGRSEGHLVLTKNDKVIYPMDGSGGGVVDVIAFALRLSLWKAQGKDIANTFTFDEPFRFLSVDLHDRLAEFLVGISHELSVQFIIVTHEEGFTEYADKNFLVKEGVVTPSE